MVELPRSFLQKQNDQLNPTTRMLSHRHNEVLCINFNRVQINDVGEAIKLKHIRGPWGWTNHNKPKYNQKHIPVYKPGYNQIDGHNLIPKLNIKGSGYLSLQSCYMVDLSCLSHTTYCALTGES